MTMKKAMRVIDNVIVEIAEYPATIQTGFAPLDPEGDPDAPPVPVTRAATIADCLPPGFVDALAGVAVGWVKSGNRFVVPPPVVIPPAAPVVPSNVTRPQALIALLVGKSITEAMICTKIAEITDATEREVTRIRFESATWQRQSQFITFGKAAFALSDADVDALFIAAGAL